MVQNKPRAENKTVKKEKQSFWEDFGWIGEEFWQAFSMIFNFFLGVLGLLSTSMTFLDILQSTLH